MTTPPTVPAAPDLDPTINLAPGEPHPMAYQALEYLRLLGREPLFLFQKVLVADAAAGNRCAAIMGETLRRLLNREPVSDCYLLGLAFFICLSDCKRYEDQSQDQLNDETTPTT